MDIRSFFGRAPSSSAKKKKAAVRKASKTPPPASKNVNASDYFSQGNKKANGSKAKAKQQKATTTPNTGLQTIQTVNVHDVEVVDLSASKTLKKRKTSSPSSADQKTNLSTSSQKRSKQSAAADGSSTDRSHATSKSTPKRSEGVSSKAESITKREKSTTPASAQKQSGRKWNPRGGQQIKPPRLGQKELPKGHHDCLKGKTFVLTGVLDSLERPDATELIRNHGGRVTGSVSGRTSFLLIGSVLEDGRPATDGKKAQKATELKVPLISEDELFDMIRKTKPASPSSQPKSNKQASSTQGQQQASKYSSAVKGRASASGKKAAKAACDKKHSLWSVKYRPVRPNELIGNNQNVAKLTQWLKGWDRKYMTNNKGVKRTPAALKAFNSSRGCMLSGAPGIGKTSAATLIAKSLGYEVVEFNASDKRSKGSMNILAEAVNSRTMRWGASAGHQQRKKQRVVIMDEVDGMGGGDRGGGVALGKIIATSRSPVICICNDVMKKSISSLRTVCMGLKFRKPMKRTIARRMQQVATAEGLQIDDQAMEALVESVGNDIRQVLNALQMMSRRVTGRVNYSDMKERLRVITKDAVLRMTPFTAISEIFDMRKPFNSRYEAFFVDYQLMPLLVQQSYASVLAGSRHVKDKDKALCSAANAIADLDLMATSTGGMMNWSLLKYQAALSLEAAYHCNGFLGQANFPSWFGQNSKLRGRKRLLREMSTHISSGLSCSVGPGALRRDYLHTLRLSLMRPIVTTGAEGIDELIEGLREYGLTREDLMEKMPEFALETRASQRSQGAKSLSVPSKVKSALTRKYNKSGGRVSQGAALTSAKGIDKDKIFLPVKKMPAKKGGKKKKKAPAKKRPRKKAAGSAGKKRRAR